MPARPSSHMTSFLSALPLFLPNIRVEWRPKSRPRKRWPVNWDPNSVKTEWDLDMIVRGFHNSRFIWFKALFVYEVCSKCGYHRIRDWTVWLTTIPTLNTYPGLLRLVTGSPRPSAMGSSFSNAYTSVTEFERVWGKLRLSDRENCSWLENARTCSL